MPPPISIHCLSLLPTHFHPFPCAQLMPTGPCPNPFPSTPLRALTVRARPRLHARSCPLGLSSQSIPPLHARMRIRSSTIALLPTHFHPFPCPHTVRACPRIHARSCPPGPSPTHFHQFPCTHNVRTRVYTHPRSLLPTGPFSLPISILSLALTLSAHVRVHLRSLTPTLSLILPTPHPFPSTPLRPHLPHTSVHPRSLIPTGFMSIHSLAHTPSAHIRSSTLAHAHRTLLRTHFHSFSCAHVHRSQTSAQISFCNTTPSCVQFPLLTQILCNATKKEGIEDCSFRILTHISVYQSQTPS